MSTKRGEGAAKLDEMIAQFDQFYADAQRADSKGTKLGSGYFWEWATRGRELKAALEASSPSALIAAVEAQMKIAENHLAEAKNDAKEEGWDSETVEYAGRQEGKVLAFLAVLKLLRSPPTEAAER